MIITSEILPKYYNYLKFAKCKSFLEIPKPILKNTKNIKLDINTLKANEHNAEEITQAYRAYQQNPYINYYLRANKPLTKEGNEIISCLNQAINFSKPTSGNFMRGITGIKTNPINDQSIGSYIFNNKGFISTAPIEEKQLASCFAIGRNSALVEFEITKPTKAFNANRYETIFAPNTFTPDKFKIKKVADGYCKVTQIDK